MSKSSQILTKELSSSQRAMAFRVGIGMTLYNGERFLKTALNSLRKQTFKDYGLIIIDDGSTDGSSELIQRYLAKLPNVVFFKNKKRAGMVATWKQAFKQVLKAFPQVEYFAWASDHDIWDEQWLETLVAAMDKKPELVLTYPQTQMFMGEGVLLDKLGTVFDTSGQIDIIERFKYVCENIVGAGNMVYGLFRVAALKKTGVFRKVLMPDRLLIFEISLFGEIEQIQDRLWLRRFVPEKKSALSKQRKTLFVNSPWYIYLPWWFLFTTSFLWEYGVKKQKDFPVSRSEILYLSWFLFKTQGINKLRRVIAKKIRIQKRKLKQLLSK